MKPLWKHQEAAIREARNKDNYGLLFDTGCGKSRTAIEIIRDRYNMEKRLLPTLILCPLIVTRNWKAEFLKFSKIPPERIVTLEGSQNKRIKDFALNVLTNPDKIVILNYDALSAMANLYQAIYKWKPEVLICDEMHLIKNHSAIRTKKVHALSASARFRYGLTGTAILNNPMDIWSQWKFLDQGKLFGTNFFAFRGQYFYDKNAGMPSHVHFPKWEVRPQALEQVKAMMQSNSMSVQKEDALDLPPLVKIPVEVELSPKQRKHYDELKQDLITFLKDSSAPVVALNALTKTLRLMQICSGFIKNEDGEIVDFKDNPKADALHELLESIIPNKTIIWCVFKKDYDAVKAVCNKLKIKFVECNGDTPNNQKFKNVELFENDKETKVFIGHPQSLGIGINLVAAKYMIYYSRTFSLGEDIQSEARNYRAGTELLHDKVTRYDIVAKDTIDVKCMEALHNKKEISDKVLSGWIIEN